MLSITLSELMCYLLATYIQQSVDLISYMYDPVKGCFSSSLSSTELIKLPLCRESMNAQCNEISLNLMILPSMTIDKKGNLIWMSTKPLHKAQWVPEFTIVLYRFTKTFKEHISHKSHKTITLMNGMPATETFICWSNLRIV